MKSVISIFLNTLGLVPSNSNFAKFKEIIEDIPTSLLCSKLTKHLFGARSDRSRLIKSLKLDPKEEGYLIRLLPEYDDTIWNRLRFCGSGISQDMFENIAIHGDISSNHKLLPNKYTREFIDHFEYLWLRDKALRRIEWKLLQIGSLPNQKPLLFYIPEDTAKYILKEKTNLIDVIAIKCECWSPLNQNLFTITIGQALLWKAKEDPNISEKLYQSLERWLKLDPLHATVILGDSLGYDHKHKYDRIKLEERFEIRIRSSKKLTGKFNSLVNPNHEENKK